jgi:hypothetical protein
METTRAKMGPYGGLYPEQLRTATQLAGVRPQRESWEDQQRLCCRTKNEAVNYLENAEKFN